MYIFSCIFYRSGKSSIYKVVFQKMSPTETLFLESTSKLFKDDVTNSSFIQFSVWDFPGQLDIFLPHFFQLNPTYMKRILHFKNITFKSSYNWFKIDIHQQLRPLTANYLAMFKVTSTTIYTSLNYDTKILTETDAETFFPIPDFPKPKPKIFSETKFSETDTETLQKLAKVSRPKPKLRHTRHIPDTYHTHTRNRPETYYTHTRTYQ